MTAPDGPGLDQLGPASRALLDAARDGLAPDPAAIARVKAKVAATAVTVGAGALAAKLAVLTVVAAIAGGAVMAVRSNAADPRGPAPTTATLIEPAQIGAPAPIPPTSAEPATEIAPLVIADERRAEAPAPATAAPRRPSPAPDRAPVGLGREVELVDAAMAALRGGDAKAALGVVRTYLRVTRGTGQLAEDIAAIEVEALCTLGDPRAAGRLAAFDRRWPASAQRARLTNTCR
jgi:hypothetical protein